MKDNKPLAIIAIFVIVVAVGFLVSRAFMGNNSTAKLNPEDEAKYGIPPAKKDSPVLPPLDESYIMDKGVTTPKQGK